MSPSLSYEIFPPRTATGRATLAASLVELRRIPPALVSVTYGAGGSDTDRSFEAVRLASELAEAPVAAHLTCVGVPRHQVATVIDTYLELGVRHIVALRGDAPKGQATFTPHADGFASSVELIEALADTGQFTIRVGAYPEKHPEAVDQAADIAFLKRKIDAGATSAITQFFFEADTFFRFRDACAKAGITAPIIPRILPIENWSGAQRFADQCGTHIPQVIRDAFTNATRDGTTDLLATALATELCDDLVRGGVDHLHFYTLNRPELTRDVCHALGITPKARLQNVA